MFGLRKQLHNRGVLNINRRNAEYVLKYNSRALYPRVDDKLLTKELARDANVAAPELFGVVRYTGQVRKLKELLKPYEDFVIKPARGSGGEGILVIAGRPQGLYRKTDGMIIDDEQICHHVFNILSGMYSLGGSPDKAFVEYRVRFHPMFEAISFQGVPDIRTVLFFGVPVMCMLRLPTRMSHGRANLHQGAVGVGVDLATGITTEGVWGDKTIDEHPDTGNKLSGVAIPHWQKFMLLSASCYELTQIPYQGVDLVLDQNLGPLLLEVNARPGLNVQIANKCGLLPRLQKVEEHLDELGNPEERVAFAKEVLTGLS